MSRMRWFKLATGVVAAGTLFQFTSCIPEVGQVAGFFKNFNYCGTVLANCDPITYRFLTSGYQGPGADPTIDPACTYPPFCNRMTPGSDPFSPP